MKKDRFVIIFSDVSKQFGRRITDDYFRSVYDLVKAEGWKEELVQALVSKWIMQPPREINGEAIKSSYIEVYRENLNNQFKMEEKRENRVENKAHVMMFLKFVKWPARKASYQNPTQFRALCKYTTLDPFEKELVDAYIAGRLDNRAPVGDPDWMS